MEANPETVITTVIPGQPESEQPSNLSSELETEQLEDVATVADEILAEVKECKTELNQTTAALERLQSEGGPANSNQIVELQTEVKNLREEMRNLLNELKTLQQGQANPQSESLRDSSQSTPLPLTETAVVVIDPVEDVSPVERTVPKKKRYRI